MDQAVVSSIQSDITIGNINRIGPTCNPDGEIVITATGNPSGPLQYSIDNGDNRQSSNTFDDLAAGDYDILVRDGE